MIKSKSRSCYGCIHYSDGNCRWFNRYKQQRPKLIPMNILNEGCNKYEPKIKWVDENPVIRKLVELFEGEFL